MLFSLLSTRVISRNAIASSLFAFRRTQPSLITRSFSVSSVAWTRAATAAAKPSAKNTVSKEKTASKSTKKPAAKKPKTKKAAPKPKKVKKKKTVVKKPTPRLKIKAEDKPPKAPGGPYIQFFRKYFAGSQQMEGENGSDMVRRVSREAGVSWKALSEHEKQAFSDEVNAAQVEYKKKLEEYLKNVDPAIIKEINKRRAIKGKKKLFRIRHSKPTTPYFIFASEQRANTPGITTLQDNQNFASEMGKKWRSLSNEEKMPYMEKYNEAVKAFNESPPQQ